MNAVDDRRTQASRGFSAATWGGRRESTANLSTDRLFTSQTWDDISGLYWYGSRYYDPNLGRFCQPDTVVPDLTDPQALNRYSYVSNNPLRYSDPTGHDKWASDPQDPASGTYRGPDPYVMGVDATSPAVLVSNGGASLVNTDPVEVSEDPLGAPSMTTPPLVGVAKDDWATTVHNLVDWALPKAEGAAVGFGVKTAVENALTAISPTQTTPIQYLDSWDRVKAISYERLPTAQARSAAQGLGRALGGAGSGLAGGFGRATDANIVRGAAQVAGVGLGVGLRVVSAGLGTIAYMLLNPDIAYSE